MGYTIYHCLDRQASVFGIHGRYILVMGALALMSAVLGTVVGCATQMLIGAGAAIGAAIASYMGVVWLQARVSERDLVKMILHRRMPLCWSMPSSRVRKAWRGLNGRRHGN